MSGDEIRKAAISKLVQLLLDDANRRSEEDKAALEVAQLAGRLAVYTLGAYQRDDAAAMRAFGSNAEAHVARQLAAACLRYKILYQERVAPEPEKA